jgi:hypothetical protein
VADDRGGQRGTEQRPDAEERVQAVEQRRGAWQPREVDVERGFQQPQGVPRHHLRQHERRKRRAGGQVQAGCHEQGADGAQHDPDTEPLDQRARAQAGQHVTGGQGEERDPDRGAVHAVVAHLRRQQNAAGPGSDADQHEG